MHALTSRGACETPLRLDASMTPVRLGVYCGSRGWATVLGCEAVKNPTAVSIGDTIALWIPVIELGTGPHVRAYLRNSANQLRELGARTALLLCQGRCIRDQPESVFVISDHVNWTGDNPLIGMRDGEPGDRFVDMAETYDSGIASVLHRSAADANIRVEKGVAVDGEGPMPSDSVTVAQAAVTSLALPAVAARQAGLTVGAVAWLGPAQGTESTTWGLDTKGLRSLIESVAGALVAGTSVS